MWLMVRMIDFKNRDSKSGIAPEYDVLVNMDNVKAVRPNQNRTCTIMYLDSEQNEIVRDGLDHFQRHLDPQSAKVTTIPINTLINHQPLLSTDEPPVEEKKKPFVPKGTTSAAINQG